MSRARVKVTKDMVIAADKLIADTQFAIHNLMEAKDVSRRELARALDVSEPRISQLFHDTTNLTLRTIARIFHVLGEDARITSRTLDRLIPAEWVADEHPSLWRPDGSFGERQEAQEAGNDNTREKELAA
jgi:transcriptional regulator with XRE-family HTH domain